VREAALDAKGPLGALGLSLSAAGSQADQPFDLRAQAEVAALGEPRSVNLRSFGGRLAGQRLELVSPARLSLDGGVLDLDQLDLKVGPAQVQGSLRYGNGQARGEVRLAALPLGMLEGFGAPPLQGNAQGRLTLAGTTAAPRLALDLGVRGLRPGGAGDGSPAVTLDLDGTASGGRVQARLTVAGLAGERPLAAEVSFPAELSLEPAAFAVARDAPIAGRVAGPVDLARVAALAALDRQRVAGLLRADLRVGGTLAGPRLDGSLGMAGGRVDDLTTGASFRDVALTARASGRRLDLADLPPATVTAARSPRAAA
jgi:translocation and assembly module TamB